MPNQPRDRAGRFSHRAHAESDVALASSASGDDLRSAVEALETHGMVPTRGHLRVLDAVERSRVGSKMARFCKDWDGFLADPAFMATCKIVSAPDGSGLVTGQTSVHADVLLDMPDDIEEAIAAGDPYGDAWDPLPVVLKLGRQRVVRDGHHRLMRRLLVGEPVRYRYVTEADLIAWQRRPAA